jgi:hypothetical protein
MICIELARGRVQRLFLCWKLWASGLHNNLECLDHPNHYELYTRDTYHVASMTTEDIFWSEQDSRQELSSWFLWWIKFCSHNVILKHPVASIDHLMFIPIPTYAAFVLFPWLRVCCQAASAHTNSVLSCDRRLEIGHVRYLDYHFQFIIYNNNYISFHLCNW